MLALVGVVAWALIDKAREMRSAAELNAFRYSLGALRVALVLDRMRTAVREGAAVGGTPRNPFLLLAYQLPTYAGEVSLPVSKAGAIAPGAWFFDGGCPCIGYRPRDERRFLAVSGSPLLIFQLSSANVLAARESYLWRGEVVD